MSCCPAVFFIIFAPDYELSVFTYFLEVPIKYLDFYHPPYVLHVICNGNQLDLNIELRVRQEREEVAHLRDGPLFESVSRGPIMGVSSPLLRPLKKVWLFWKVYPNKSH